MRFKFIDRILSLTDVSACAIRNISINECVFESHFESNPIYPASLIIESCIELARYMVWNKTLFISSADLFEIKNINFKRAVYPGDKIIISANNTTDSLADANCSNISIDFNGSSEDQKIFHGRFILNLIPHESLHNREKSENQLEVLRRCYQ